jgi:DNA-binding transcriptional LysR family regulator
MTIKLSLESLEVLDAIDRKGSFAAAAESLFKVPSALTYTVRKLEEDLGVKLFNRSGHRAILTIAGAELLTEGRHLLNAATELELRVKRVASGIETELAIAVSDLFELTAIYPVLDQFYAQNFGTRLKILREVYGGSWDALTSGHNRVSLCGCRTSPFGQNGRAIAEPRHNAVSFCVCGRHIAQPGTTHFRNFDRTGCVNRTRYASQTGCANSWIRRGLSAKKTGGTICRYWAVGHQASG